MNAYSVTDVGLKRKINQDYAYVSIHPVGNLSNLFIVADGMGGHRAGDFASRYTVEELVNTIRDDEEYNPIKIIRSAIQTANRNLIQKSSEEEEMRGMGTTIVAATIVDHFLYVANVGDSRLYVVGEDIRQITRDHSLVEEMIRIGEINREQARKHPDKNIITRAIGVSKEVAVDFFDLKLGQDDIVLICSDGLTNMLEDDEIKEIIKSGSNISGIAGELIEKANINGGKDNIAVILVEPFADEVEEC